MLTRVFAACPAAALAAVLPLVSGSIAIAQCTPRWQPAGLPTAGSIYSMASLPSGDILVGGSFPSSATIPTTNLALFHPATGAWSGFGPGSGAAANQIYALAPLPSGDVVIGGTFLSVPGTSGYIARWNAATNTWASMGNLDGAVHAIVALPSGDIIAGGEFTHAGSTVVNYIARWNSATNTWSALGTGFNDYVLSLATLPNGDVLAGGEFQYNPAHTLNANYIARWNAASQSWSALGSGMSYLGQVYAITSLPNGDIIAGGFFSTAGGVPVSNIARWDAAGSAWHALPSTLPSEVYSLATLPSGEILVGGNFSSIAAVSPPTAAARIARWNPQTGIWSALASGTTTNSTVRCIAALPQGDLAIGGTFQTVAGTPSRGLAISTTRPTCAADFDCSGTLTTNDIFEYVTAWFAQAAPADFNRAGGVTIQDVFDFLNAWLAGCP